MDMSTHNYIFVLPRYRPLYFSNIVGHPYVISKNVKYFLPKFSNNYSKSIEEHLDSFRKIYNNLGIKHEDILMRTFV